jgi:hypothetical protein
LRKHLHYTRWLELRALALDGVAFSRRGLQGGSWRGGGEGAEPLLAAKLAAAAGKRDKPDGQLGGGKGASPKMEKGKEKKAPKHAAKRADRPAPREAARGAPPSPPAAEPAREWQPTRSVLQQGARETGVKVGAHVPGQGLR